MKKLFILLISVATFVSCSDPEAVTYNDSKTFVGFENDVYNLGIPRDLSTTIDIKFASSSVSSVVRTYNVSVINEVSDADPRTYSVPATFTIPANSRFGTLTISGTDGGLVDATVKKFVLKISGFGPKETADSDILTIYVFEFCPVDPDTFPGLFSSTTWWNGPGAVDEVIMGAAEGSIEVVNFFSDDAANPNFVIKYDVNNKITFTERNTGYFDALNGGFRWARLSTDPTKVSEIDACTGRITVWVNYFIPNIGSFGDKQEVFIKQ